MSTVTVNMNKNLEKSEKGLELTVLDPRLDIDTLSRYRHELQEEVFCYMGRGSQVIMEAFRRSTI